MSPADSLVLFSACFAAMASPGPGVAALVARAASVGVAGSLPFIAGMIAGDLVLFMVALAGMAGLQTWLAPLMPALTAAAGLWLLWLGVKQWRTADMPLAAANAPDSFFAAWLLTIGNPKTLIFYLALLPTIVGPRGMGLGDALAGGAIVAATLSAVMLGYAGLTRMALGLLSHPRPLRRACAVLMAGVGLLLLAQAGRSVY